MSIKEKFPELDKMVCVVESGGPAVRAARGYVAGVVQCWLSANKSRIIATNKTHYSERVKPLLDPDSMPCTLLFVEAGVVLEIFISTGGLTADDEVISGLLRRIG